MEQKPWLDSTTPLIAISAVSSAEPVRGHYGPRVRKLGRCYGARRNHSWINGRCWWCGKARNA